MRGVMSEVPESLLAWRRLTGAERFDETWAGVLHMNPSPTPGHQDLEFEDIRRIAREAREQLVELGQPAQRVPCHPDRPLAELCQIAQRPIGGVLQPVFARC